MRSSKRISILYVSLWYNQNVLLCNWSYVFERDNMVILITQRLAICNNLAKLALLKHFIVTSALKLYFFVKVVRLIGLDRPASDSDCEHKRKHQGRLFCLFLRERNSYIIQKLTNYVSHLFIIQLEQKR